MSHGRAIDPLPLDDFPQESDTQDPGFEELFNQLVGDAATSTDGFDDDVQIANDLLDSLDGALTSLGGQEGGTLDDTFLEILELDPRPAGQDVVNLAAALPDVQTNVDNLGNLVANAALPSPSTGTGAGGPPAGCDAVLGFDAINNKPPVTRQVNFTVFGAGVVLTIDTNTLDQDTPGLFTMATSPLGQVPAGQPFQINVTLTTGAPAAIHGKITTTWHIQDGVEHTSVLCLGVNVPDNFPQPSLGGGGGGPPIGVRPTPPGGPPPPAPQ